MVSNFFSGAFKILSAGDIAALIYLWNPLTIVTCVGSSTSPFENLMVVLALYGACSRKKLTNFAKPTIQPDDQNGRTGNRTYGRVGSRLIPLAAFGWVIATHLSLYPAILIIPVVLLIGHGPDSPPRKLFLQRNCGTIVDNSSTENHQQCKEVTRQPVLPVIFSWRPVMHFMLWASIWSFYVLVLCGVSVKQYGGLWEMLKKTYGFITTVEDLSPNIGVLWYFFAEVFDFFRDFFLIVFHVNILFMILPLAIRLNHRPCFLAFVYIAISSMLKSYPSGTGNANFYFATAMAYACLQIILVVESVGAMLNHDRMLRKQSTT
ncbi:hypothetical protein HHK36_000276 [Tetracentron sinense]|uniref:GPI transamidase subunit PIG-U n=1 Tax=Tetracentron sinense TaxID=13715 RepID=A0A834ZVL7_TETSI|nr:hypothetical protein HHK36_000276 [Tetracentron sinense]